MSTAGALALPSTLEYQPKQRISRKVREAIRLMVEEALARPDAAQRAGLKDHSLYLALRDPRVISYRTELMQVLRTSAASRTIARAEMLADKAESEHVKLQANTWLAGIEGIAPIAKSESISTHKHLVAGLVIVRGAEPVIEAPVHVIDGHAHEVRKPRQIMRIGEPVPHPNQRNAMADEANRAVDREAGE